MLIEASKGGHAQVVKLLLDWTGSSNSSPSDELSQSSLSQSSLDLQQVSSSVFIGLTLLFMSCSFCTKNCNVWSVMNVQSWTFSYERSVSAKTQTFYYLARYLGKCSEWKLGYGDSADGKSFPLLNKWRSPLIQFYWICDANRCFEKCICYCFVKL